MPLRLCRFIGGPAWKGKPSMRSAVLRRSGSSRPCLCGGPVHHRLQRVHPCAALCAHPGEDIDLVVGTCAALENAAEMLDLAHAAERCRIFGDESADLPEPGFCG